MSLLLHLHFLFRTEVDYVDSETDVFDVLWTGQHPSVSAVIFTHIFYIYISITEYEAHKHAQHQDRRKSKTNALENVLNNCLFMLITTSDIVIEALYLDGSQRWK